MSNYSFALGPFPLHLRHNARFFLISTFSKGYHTSRGLATNPVRAHVWNKAGCSRQFGRIWRAPPSVSLPIAPSPDAQQCGREHAFVAFLIFSKVIITNLYKWKERFWRWGRIGTPVKFRIALLSSNIEASDCK